MSEIVLAPFTYPGGKRAAAETVWSALGDVASYLEPHAGSLAVLLSRPGGPGKYELINDSSGLVVNVWRAIRECPSETALYCADPPNEVDLRARAKWLQAVGLGPDWFSQLRPSMIKPYRRGILGPEAKPAEEWFGALQSRLQKVGMACGDWERLLTESALGFNNTGTTPCGVFFDPPYLEEDLDYGAEPGCAKRVEVWCREHGNDKRLRVVLAGHIGDYNLPGWTVVNWGGSRGWGRKRRGENECLWLSPHCLPLVDVQPSLFAAQGVG